MILVTTYYAMYLNSLLQALKVTHISVSVIYDETYFEKQDLHILKNINKFWKWNNFDDLWADQ